MNINCPQCGKEYEIDDAKIPEGGAKVKCSQCETMIDIDFPVVPAPDWYITTDGENIYEATTQEVTEWIQENRLLKEHKISKDNENWTTLEENPKFLVIFKNKEELEAIEEEPTQENTAQEEPVVKAYKKIDYTDYDDSIIETSDTYKPKKSHFFIWFFLFLIMGAGIFALIKPKLVKSWFTKMNSKNNTNINTNYKKAVSLSKQYNLQNKDKILSLFDNALKKNPKDIKSLTGKALYITHIIYLENLNVEFRTKLSQKLEIISKQNNNEIINKILLKNNKKLLQSKKTLKELEALLDQEYKNKLKEIEKTKNNYNASIIMGLLSYFDTNKNTLLIHLSNAKKLDLDNSETSLLKLLYLKLKKDNSYLVVLDESTTKYSESIPLSMLSAFELLKQDKYGEAKSSFKGIKGLTPNNKLVLEYILLLNKLIKNKDLLVVNKPSDKESNKDNPTKQDKDKNKVEKKNSTVSTKNNPKEVKKTVKKEVKKLSASRATEMGWNLIDANKLSSAIKKFKYSISVNPNYADAYQGLGEVYRIKKDNKNAIKYYKIFLAKDPNNSEAGLVRRQIKKLSSDK